MTLLLCPKSAHSKHFMQRKIVLLVTARGSLASKGSRPNSGRRVKGFKEKMALCANQDAAVLAVVMHSLE
jgi:hypothetical protein